MSANTTWRSFRADDVSGGYTGDGATPVGTGSIPSGVHNIAKGDLPDKDIDVLVRLLDASGDDVAAPGMTFDIELVELIDDGVVRPPFVISAGSASGANPYTSVPFSGASWTPRAGMVGVHITNVAGFPGAADSLHVYIRAR